MAGLAAYAGAGALKGGGEALEKRTVEAVKAKKEQALEALRQRNRIGLEDKKAGDRRGLLDTKHGYDTELLDIREEGENKRNAASNASRERAAGIRSDKKTDSSSAESRAWKMSVEAATKTDENGLETVDWKAVADDMKARGYKNAAQSAQRQAKGVEDTDIQRQAEEQADKEIEEIAGVFTTDAQDFKEDGGSRTRYRARRIREIKEELSGGGAKKGPETREAAAPDKPKAAPDDAATTRQAGQQKTPFDVQGTADQQRKILDSIPVGGVARKNGVLYEKLANGKFKKVETN